VSHTESGDVVTVTQLTAEPVLALGGGEEPPRRGFEPATTLTVRGSTTPPS
jgi:hypothetical protein